MPWVRRTLVLAAGTLALAVLPPDPFDTPPRSLSPPPAPPPALPRRRMTDTIRTDLSDYQWPTDAGRAVTSTFGEYRSTHFHGGIDISTGDVTGYRVFASRAGDIARITVNPTGYGKILYLRHPDGYTTTYAHLRGFAPAMEQRVRAEQEHLQQYPVSIECAAGEFRVQKGDLIAFTGETGAGSPHLHFEIRDDEMNGVNPMLAPQLDAPDNIPPAFRKIAFAPLTPGSTVNNSMDPVTMRVRMVNPRSFTVAGDVTIAGSAGVGVYVRDRGDETYYSRGVYRHRLFVDGRLHFETRFDRVPMRESQQIGLYYIRDLLRERAGRFEKLFVDSRTTLPFLAHADVGSGWLSPDSLTPGRHTIAILSQDFAGNTSQLTATVVLTPAPPALRAREADGRIVLTTPQPNRTTRVLVEGKGMQGRHWSRLNATVAWDSAGSTGMFVPPGDAPPLLRIRAATDDSPWSAPAFIVRGHASDRIPAVHLAAEPVQSGVRVVISSDEVLTGSPSLAVEEGSVRRLFPLSAADEHHVWAVFAPLDSVQGDRTLAFEGAVNTSPVRAVETITIYPVLPGRRGTVKTDNGDFRLDYDSLSVYDTLYIQIRTAGSQDSRIYELLPERAVVREGFTVTLRADLPAGPLAVYRRAGNGWALLGQQHGLPVTPEGNPAANSTPGSVSARLTDRLGTLAVLADTEPPLLTSLRCSWRGRNRVLATFRVWDDLSGVDYKTLKAYIDGKFVIPEIDGEHRRATVLAPEGLTRGPHHLQVRVQDNMGNPAVLERRFAVP